MISAIVIAIAAAGILGWLLVQRSSAATATTEIPPEVEPAAPTEIPPAVEPAAPAEPPTNPPTTPPGHGGSEVVSSFAQTVEAFIRGVARAEGYFDPVRGSGGDCSNLPCRANNPCDLTESFGFPHLGPENSEGVLHFASLEDGWNAAREKARLILGGRDRNWPANWTLEQMGHRYTGQPVGSNALDDWVAIVAEALAVQPKTTLREVSNA